jgi:U4/U6 small nuclear ribonucleoprotein PRP31
VGWGDAWDAWDDERGGGLISPSHPIPSHPDPTHLTRTPRGQFICDKYAPRFPELESLVVGPIDYARTVKAIGNEMDLTRVDLKSFLPTATVMVITVTATTSIGKPIPVPEDIQHILEACDIVIELTSSRSRILEYVESRMTFIAPNLSAIIGANVSAKLMALAGGLTALSKIPACDLLVMGAQKRVNTGMSSVSQERHQGVIYGCDMIASIAPEYRRQAARMTSAKCALAARIDRARSARDGFHGHSFRLELEKKIEVLQAPNPGSKTRALPIPDEGTKKRRAGKRVRRAKEKLAITELRKAQNRMSFGVQEEEVSIGSTGETIGLGMVSGSLSGKLRAAQADVRVKGGLGPPCPLLPLAPCCGVVSCC